MFIWGPENMLDKMAISFFLHHIAYSYEQTTNLFIIISPTTIYFFFPFLHYTETFHFTNQNVSRQLIQVASSQSKIQEFWGPIMGNLILLVPLHIYIL